MASNTMKRAALLTDRYSTDWEAQPYFMVEDASCARMLRKLLSGERFVWSYVTKCMLSTCLEDASGHRFFACNQATEATAWACRHHSHSHLDDVAVSRPFHPVASDALVHLETHRATCHSIHPPDLGGFIVHDDDGWAATMNQEEAQEEAQEESQEESQEEAPPKEAPKEVTTCGVCGAAMVPYVSEDHHNYTCDKCGCTMIPEAWYACSERCEYDACLRCSSSK